MQNRRNFLKNTLLTATGEGFAGKILAGSTHPSKRKGESIIYRTLGRTGEQAPIISMGTEIIIKCLVMYLKTNLPDSFCKSCSSCVVECPAGFDAKEKLTDISRIRNIPKDLITHV